MKENQRELWNRASKAYYSRNAKAINAQRGRLLKELRLAVVRAFGGKCRCCGYDDIFKTVRGKAFLQIDHVFGGGRKELLQLGPATFYRRLRALLAVGSKELSKYRVLCGGCNASMEPGQEKCELHK